MTHYLLISLSILLFAIARCDDGNENTAGTHRTPEPTPVRIDPTAHIWSDGYYAFVVSRTDGGALRFRGLSCRKREAEVSFRRLPYRGTRTRLQERPLGRRHPL